MRGESGTEKCAPDRARSNQTLRAPRVSAGSRQQTGPTAQPALYKHSELPPASAPPPSRASQQSRARKGAVNSGFSPFVFKRIPRKWGRVASPPPTLPENVPAYQTTPRCLN